MNAGDQELRAEIRCLRVTVQRLGEENRDLRERVAFLSQELERMRAKVPARLSTS